MAITREPSLRLRGPWMKWANSEYVTISNIPRLNPRPEGGLRGKHFPSTDNDLQFIGFRKLEGQGQQG